MRRALAILAATAVAGAGSQAHAGAWTQKRGETLQIYTFLYDRASERFNDDGDGGLNADFRKYEFDAYLEYGVTDRVTAVARAPYQWLRDGDVRADGAGDFEIALRARLFETDNLVVSFQPMIGFPGEVGGGAQAPLISRGRLYEARGLAGGGWGEGRWFWNAEAAHRWRVGPAPNEWRGDLTVGWKPTEKWEAFAQSFNTVSGGGAAPPFDDFRSNKAQVSVLRKFGGAFGVQTGAFRSVSGRNTIEETGVFVALWIGPSRLGWGRRGGD